MSFESFRNLFNKTEDRQQSDGAMGSDHAEAPPESNGLLSESEFQVLLDKRSNKYLPENERADAARRLEEDHKRRKEWVERDLAEWKVREAPNVLRRQALEKLPQAEHELDRALNVSGEDVYAKDFISAEKGESPFLRFLDLNNSVRTLEEWKDYLPKEQYEAKVQKIRDHAEEIKRTMDEYRSWASAHEPAEVTKETSFELIANLRRIDPNNFPRNLIDLSDQEFTEIGTGGMTLRDGRNHVRKLLARARLAEFDSERFRRIFGPEYSPERMAEARKYWEEWDQQYPTDMPQCSVAWKKIDRSLEDRKMP